LNRPQPVRTKAAGGPLQKKATVGACSAERASFSSLYRMYALRHRCASRWARISSWKTISAEQSLRKKWGTHGLHGMKTGSVTRLKEILSFFSVYLTKTVEEVNFDNFFFEKKLIIFYFIMRWVG
jgi:hypothetical protein